MTKTSNSFKSIEPMIEKELEGKSYDDPDGAEVKGKSNIECYFKEDIDKALRTCREEFDKNIHRKITISTKREMEIVEIFKQIHKEIYGR